MRNKSFIQLRAVDPSQDIHKVQYEKALLPGQESDRRVSVEPLIEQLIEHSIESIDSET